MTTNAKIDARGWCRPRHLREIGDLLQGFE